MNEEEKSQIRILRAKGCSYHQIAEIMNMKISTVSNYCLRNNVDAPDAFIRIRTSLTRYRVCPICGQLFMLNKMHDKQFCSQKCRSKYWRKEQQQEASLAKEVEEHRTLQKELDFLREKSDEWLDGRVCRKKEQ